MAPVKFGPKKENHPLCGQPCPACGELFKVGDYTTLVTLGPGRSEEDQEKCREGRAYNAVAVEVHYDCATGE